MFFGDNSSDSDDLPINYLKQERTTTSNFTEIENQLKNEIIPIPWKQIADKFWKCMLTNSKSSTTIVEFLDSLLTFIRKGPKDSRTFTKSIFNYLLAAKYVASKEAVHDSYFDRMRHVLVLYCLLELRLMSCFDDDSMVASDIFLKITLLMEGSNSTAILDVLIDIDEEMQGSRSTSIIKTIYRKYLTKTLVGGPIELCDNNFIKHLIVFHSWYKAEVNIIEKTNVLKLFLSAIKPSQQLIYNPVYSNYLPPYNPDESGGYRKLLQETLLRKNLILALRDAERTTDCQNDCENVNSIDLTDDENVIKSEVNACLNLPNEVITIDDDDDDNTIEISYLEKLYEKLDDLNHSEQRLALHRSVPIDTVDIISSDSDAEINEIHDGYVTSRDVADVSNLSIINNIDDAMRTQLTNAQPRSRSFTNNILGKPKKVSFSNPPVTYVFERCDYTESSNTHSDQRISDYIVTGPQCSFPYATTGFVRHAPSSSSPVNEIDSGPKESTEIKTRKYRKRKRSQNYNKFKRTSIDDWIKRKKIDDALLTIESKKRKRAEKESHSAETTDSNNLLLEVKKCRVVLSRCNVSESNETNLAINTPRLSFNEDMTLKEMIETKQRNFTENIQSSSVASNDLIPSKFNSSVKKSSKKSSLRKKRLKSKSVIKPINKKSAKRKESTCKTSKEQSKNSVRSTVSEKTVVKPTVNPKLIDCFVLLDKLNGFYLTSKGTSSKKSRRRSNNQLTKHSPTNETNFRLPTKSPQEYQFKRSFEKIPVYEQASTAQLSDCSPIITSVTSISSDQLVANDEANQPSQSIHHVLDSTSTPPQLEISLQPPHVVRTMFINQLSETITELESSPPLLPQSESTNDTIHSEPLSTIKCKMKIVREVTSCSPDTTTSSTPQFLLTPDINGSASTDPIEEIECDEKEPHSLIHCDKNLEKRLRMTFDDCDNDIPSPVYSPYEGRRKNYKSEISLNHTSQTDEFKNAVNPIDLRLKVINNDGVVVGDEINNSTNTTISSTQPILTLTDDLNLASL